MANLFHEKYEVDKTDVNPLTGRFRINNLEASGTAEIELLSIHTAQTVQQYNALRHQTNDMAIVSVARPRKGHDY